MNATLRLVSRAVRDRAKRLIDAAPDGYIVTIREPTRTGEQNAKLWSLLADIARSRPLGREHGPETWKELFMHALGHEARFEDGLDGLPFPVGFRSSRLTVGEMSELIAFIEAWGAKHGVKWTDATDGRPA